MPFAFWTVTLIGVKGPVVVNAFPCKSNFFATLPSRTYRVAVCESTMMACGFTRPLKWALSVTGLPFSLYAEIVFPLKLLLHRTYTVFGLAGSTARLNGVHGEQFPGGANPVGP